MADRSRSSIRRVSRRLAPRAWVCAASLGVAACAGLGDDGLPPDLLGSWQTDEPRYENRGFAITPSTLTLHTGPGDSTVYALLRTERVDDDGAPTYTLVYEEEGEELRFSLVAGLEDGRGRWIHFPNQPAVRWRK